MKTDVGMLVPQIKWNKKTKANNAYSLWRVNGYQQGFRSVANLGFGGKKSASKPPHRKAVNR